MKCLLYTNGLTTAQEGQSPTFLSVGFGTKMAKEPVKSQEMVFLAGTGRSGFVRQQTLDSSEFLRVEKTAQIGLGKWAG